MMDKFQFQEAKCLLHDQYSCFQLVTKTIDFVLPPRFIGRTKKGINEQFEREINLYSDVLQGVLISFSNINLRQPLSLSIDDTPYLNFCVQADFIVFRPFEGCILKGIVNKISRDHIGCLVHGHFNASLPRQQSNGKGTSRSNEGKLQNGDDVTFKVTGVSSNKKVLFIQGTLIDEPNKMDVSLSQEIDTGIKKYRKKSLDSEYCIANDISKTSDSNKLDVSLHQEINIDVRKSHKNSKKKKRSLDPDIANDTINPDDPKPNKMDVCLTQENDTDVTYFHKKRKRSKKSLESQDFYTNDNVIQEEINKVKHDADVSNSNKKRKRSRKSLEYEDLISSDTLIKDGSNNSLPLQLEIEVTKSHKKFKKSKKFLESKDPISNGSLLSTKNNQPHDTDGDSGIVDNDVLFNNGNELTVVKTKRKKRKI